MRLLPLVPLLLLATACTEPRTPHDPSETAPEDTGSESTDTGADTGTDDDGCEDGQILDGEDCVPTDCGIGTWGDLPRGSFTLFVDPAGSPGGDGSLDAPFQLLVDAIAASSGDGAIALAAGLHTAPAQLFAIGSLQLSGRCTELVEITHSGSPEAPMPTIRQDSDGSTLGLSNLRLTGGLLGGLWVTNGSAALDDVVLEDNSQMGLVAVTENAIIQVSDVVVRRTGVAQGGTGIGLVAARDAVVYGGNFLSEGNQESALMIQGYARVILTNAEFRGPPEAGANGRLATMVMSGGKLDCTGCRWGDILGNALQMDGEDTFVRLVGTHIEDIRFDDDGDVFGGMDGSFGVMVDNDATFEAEDLVLARIEGNGINVTGAGRVRIHGASFSEIAPSEAIPNASVAALVVDAGSELAGSNVTMRDVEGWAAIAMFEDARLTLVDLDLEGIGVARDAAGSGAWSAGEAPGGGVAVYEGAVADVVGYSATDMMGPALMAANATLTARDVRVDGVIPTVPTDDPLVFAGPALLVGEGGSLGLSDAEVLGATGTAVAVIAGTLELDDVIISETAPAEGSEVGLDLLCQGGGGVTASRTVLASVQSHGLEVIGAGSTAALNESLLSTSEGHGAIALEGATLSLRDTRLEGRTTLGVAANGAGTRLDVQDTTITETRDGARVAKAVGVAVLGEARAEIRGLEAVEDAGVGLFVYEAWASCTDCLFDNEELVAVYARAAGLELEGTQIRNTRSVTGQGGYGLFVDALDSSPAVTLRGVEIVDHPTVGAWLRGPGTYEISDSTLGGGPMWPLHPGVLVHGDALLASDGVAAGPEGLSIQGSTFQDAEGAGIFLDKSTASLGELTFTDNAVDLLQQGCDAAPSWPAEGHEEAGTTSLCADGERIVLTPDLSFFVDISGALSD